MFRTLSSKTKQHSLNLLLHNLILFALLVLIVPNVFSQYRTVQRGERPPINLSAVPEGSYEKGVIRIKFEEAYSDQVSDFMPSFNEKGVVVFGMEQLDAQNVIYGVRAARKTFDSPALNNNFRERHRKWGFHLWYDLEVDENTDIINMVKKYMELDEVAFAEPHYKKELIGFVSNVSGSDMLDKDEHIYFDDDDLMFPDDPDFDAQWHYHNTGQTGGAAGADIGLPAAWAIETGNADVIVAIVDGGIAIDHPDLVGNMWEGVGYNFVSNSPIIEPHNHGSHVAGTVAAVSNNGLGVSGIAGGWGDSQGVRLMSCQVFLDDGWFGQSGGFEIAPVYAADNGAAISQNSWGYTVPGHYEQAVLDAIDYFNVNGGGDVMNGGLTIFAAGNNGADEPKYPAYYSGTIAVASTNHNDQRSWYSNFGAYVDIAAPGGETNVNTEQGVLSTRNTGYGYAQGTSMACPHVSGVAALMLSMAPQVFEAEEIAYILLNATTDIDDLNPGYAGLLGSGRVNAHLALLETIFFMADPEGPAAPPDFSVTANEDGELSALLTWVNPAENAGGGDLETLDAINIYRDEVLIHVVEDPVMGENSSFNDEGIEDNGIYYYMIRGANHAGLGRPAFADAFIGHDVPAKPGIISVEPLGDHALIKWPPPANGLNNGFFDGLNLQYNIVRYPCQQEVANLVSDTIFFDNTLPDFGNYYYSVTAFNHLGEGGTAVSDTVLMGAANMLYYEPFNYESGIVPEGWAIIGDGQHNWRTSNTQNAGGEAPEMRLASNPIFNGTSKLRSVDVEVADFEQISLTFRQALRNDGNVGGAGTISVHYATDDNTEMHELMHFNGTEHYGPLVEEFAIDLPEATENIRFFFQWQGITWHMNDWSIDNIIIRALGLYFDAYFVVVDQDGNSISGASIQVNNETAPEVMPGMYFVSQLTNGEYDFTVQKYGYQTYTGVIDVVDQDVTETVVLEKTGFIVSFVVTDTDEQPVENAIITLGDQTNDAGNYVFENIAQGTYDFTVEKNGYHTYTGNLEVIDEDITKTVVLEKTTFTVSFVVTDADEQPVENAIITLGDQTNDAGNYIFENIAQGTYDFTVEKNGYHTYTGNLEVIDEDITKTVVLEETTFTVSFVVTDTDEQPVENAIITLGDQTNDAGNYIFENITQGIYDFIVQKEGYHTMSDQIVVEEDITVNVTLLIVTYTVTFNVWDIDNNAITDAEITLNDFTNDPGDYFFDGLPAGIYDYMVVREGFLNAFGDVSIINQDEHLDVYMQPDETDVFDNVQAAVRIFPNPARSVLVIQSGKLPVDLNMLNTYGQTVYQTQTSDANHEICLAGFLPGLYLLQVKTTGESFIKKVIIAK